MEEKKSIFQEYFEVPGEFIDRKEVRNENGIDVIVPLLNTNELFERNLYNIYERIPINKLLIGDGGCTDNSIKIAQNFPRVTIFNQNHHKSLGYSVKELIENVETDWFLYLHADVFLPANWYDEMIKYREKYDWYECRTRFTVLVEFPREYAKDERPSTAGSQFGKKAIFEKILPSIYDDYVYRNEDFIFAGMLERNGGRIGRIDTTYTYHQIMNKRGETEPDLAKVKVIRKNEKDWEIKTFDMQARGIIKYLDPVKKSMIHNVNVSVGLLNEFGVLDWNEFKTWVQKTNPAWLKYIKKPSGFQQTLKKVLKRLAARLYGN